MKQESLKQTYDHIEIFPPSVIKQDEEDENTPTICGILTLTHVLRYSNVINFIWDDNNILKEIYFI